MANIYNNIFKKSKFIKFFEPKSYERVVYWRYTIFLDKRINIKKFIKICKKKNIITRQTYLPLHLHPIFKRKKVKFKYCEEISKSGIDIPSSTKLKEKDIFFIGNTLVRLANKSIRN